ncbi:hypothetical protein [Achromobacter xylosoxidans]|uniref:hypothetical protein n=1 Tax=Alcaligenes xylosoxydans xylosoxydans TaxID=85698 RepID=UPI0011AFF333|nr:hypothetical protein [Achromobacter xylosoxidans]
MNKKKSAPPESLDSMDFFPKDVGDLISGIATSEDELGVLLRCHLVAESILDKFVAIKRVGALNTLIQEPQQFGMKLALSSAFGMPSDFGLALHHLNGMRNKIAHGRGAKVLVSDVQEFGRKVGRLVDVGLGFVPLSKYSVRIRSVNGGGSANVYKGDGSRVDLILAFSVLITAVVAWIVENLKGNGATPHR